MMELNRKAKLLTIQIMVVALQSLVQWSVLQIKYVESLGPVKKSTLSIVPNSSCPSLKNFFQPPNAFTRNTIPVNKENIRHHEDFKQWSHLKDVCIPEINVDVVLLIGANVHKAMEPWEVVNSVNDGHYAIRTTLRWTVNGPLKESGVHQQKRKNMLDFSSTTR